MLVSRRPLALTILLSSLAPAVLEAALPARVYGTVVDESEQPVAGLTITVTDPEVAGFSLVAETNDEGKYAVILPDATRAYVYRLEKKGFETFETSFKVPAGSRKEMNFTVISVLAPDLFNEGNAAARAGDYAAAEAKYRQAVALDASLAAAHTALATVLLIEKRHAEAAQAAEDAVALAPNDQKPLNLRYKAYQALGDKAKAADALAALEAADPERAAEGLYRKGVALYQAAKMAEAAEAFDRAVTANPQHAKAHYFLGLCQVNLGDTDGAKRHLTTFLELTPDDPEAATAREMIEYLE